MTRPEPPDPMTPSPSSATPATPADRTWRDWRPDRTMVVGILGGVAVYLVVIGLGQFALAVGVAALIILTLSLVRTTRQLRALRDRARQRARDGDL